MILTMAPSDTPTTTTVPMLACTCPSKIDINNNVACSIESSNSVSNSSCEKMEMKKRVSFSLQQTAYFSPGQQLTTQGSKKECWYSEAELNVTRDEARMAIQALHHQLQLDAAAAAAVSTIGTSITEATSMPTTGTESSSSADSDSILSDGTGNGWVLRCPQDKSKIVCLRGIEKYADAAAKYAGQKRLVKSVLEQQTLNNKDVHISLVSRTLSEPFKEVARYYAMKSADELELSRKYEEQQEETERKQREEVATVLLLIMGQQQQKLKRNGVLASSSLTTKNLMLPLSSPRKSITSNSSLDKHGLILQEKVPIVTLPGSITGTTTSSSKRSSPPYSPLSERNVKPCIRSISN